MFHFPAFPPRTLYIQVRVTRHHSCWVSPFGNPRIHARLTAPRGISQPPTSFIGCRCQGIHHAPLDTYKHKNQRIKLHNRTRHQKAAHPIDARNHYPILKHHTPPPRWWDNIPKPTEMLPQDPIVCLACLLLCTRLPSTTDENPSRLTPHQLECFSWCSLERR